jgi:hypothetical protein
MKDREAIYATSDLVSLFQGLAEEGYEGLSISLIKDLIERDCSDITEGKEIEWHTSI